MTSTDQHTRIPCALHQLLDALPVPLVSRPAFRPVREFQLWLRHGAGRVHNMSASQIIEHLAAGDFDREETHHAVWRLRNLIARDEQVAA
jgi:hypothetical protein